MAARIEVDAAWRAAVSRAESMVAAHRDTMPPWVLSWEPAAVLGVVWVALARERDCPADGVDLVTTLDRLYDPLSLCPYLQLMLDATTLADRWRDVIVPPARLTTGSGGHWSPTTAAMTLVHAARLAEGGGLRLGDLVRLVPARDVEDASPAVVKMIREVDWTPMWARGGGHHPERYGVGSAEGSLWSWEYEYHLLLADETDPRGVGQAARCAAYDLSTVEVWWDQLPVSENLRRLRRRASHYRPWPQVCDILEAVMSPRVDEHEIVEAKRVLRAMAGIHAPRAGRWQEPNLWA